MSSTPRTATRRRGHARRLCRVGLVVAALLGLCVLAAGCGGGSSRQGVASLGTTTTTTGSSAGQSGSAAFGYNTALAFAQCMRTHGEPNFPAPVITKTGARTHISINVNPTSGLDPNSPQFSAATNACKHLLPNKGVPSPGQTITPADQADYLKGAACMRSHGVPDFPDPTFKNNSVTFHSSSSIDTNSSQFKTALATCDKLIPAGLPYSSSSGP